MAGNFLSNQVTGRLYVLSVRCKNWVELIDVVTGVEVRSHEVEYESRPCEMDMKCLLYDVPLDTKESFEGWYKISPQEAIGRFAKLVLTEK